MVDSRELLVVVSLPLGDSGAAQGALRSARLTAERAGGEAAVLFLCDLPDSPLEREEQDGALLRRVQSGVMSMNARRPGRYLFAVRPRRRCDALRLWLGEGQAQSARACVCGMLGGREQAFLASNFAAGSLAGRFCAVLFIRPDMRLMPQTLRQLRGRASSSPDCALVLPVLCERRQEAPLFSRLQDAGFSLFPPLPFSSPPPDEPPAALYGEKALCGAPAAAAWGGAVVCVRPSSLSGLFAQGALRMTREARPETAAAPVQLLLLLACAALGLPLAALLCMLLPEWRALTQPRLWPSALLRLILLPRRAAVSLGAMLRRRFAQARVQPSLRMGAYADFLCAALAFFPALRSARALAPAIFLALLWVGAPLVVQALSLPLRERIPLDETEKAQLRAAAEAAFAQIRREDAACAHALALCGACMMGLLEPDEAARRTQTLLPRLAPASAFDGGCLLAAGRYFEREMGKCDAALRELPAQLYAAAKGTPVSGSAGALDALLLAALKEEDETHALSHLAAVGKAQAMDALLLACASSADTPAPLMRPHSFLRAWDKKSDPLPGLGEADRFLLLSDALLDNPYEPLLLDSGPAAPYAPLLTLAGLSRR